MRHLGLAISACLVATQVNALDVASVPGMDQAPLQEERLWRFKVLLDNREIGFHEFRIKTSGALEQAEITAEFDVKILFINAYSYEHRNSESWRAGCLDDIRSITDDNGKLFDIQGEDSGQVFTLQTGQSSSEINKDCVMSFAYWRPHILQATELLNSQTGEIQPVEVFFEGSDVLPLGQQQLDAKRYLLRTPDGDISLWYGRESDQWLALETVTRGDRVLRYEAVVLPQPPLSVPSLVALD